MATYYVDPAAAGLNNGSSWVNAWTSFSSAVVSGTVVTAGDTVYCRGTQVLAAAIAVGIIAATITSEVSFIGCNSSGVEDGTRFVLNANSAAASCLTAGAGGRDYYRFRNFEFKNATSHGISLSNSQHGWIFFNCKFSNNGGMGFQGTNKMQDSVFQKCTFSGNTSDGLSVDETTAICHCLIVNNGSGVSNPMGLFGCIIHNNTTYGIEGSTVLNTLMAVACVLDGNAQGVVCSTVATSALYLLNSRLTNNTLAVKGHANCSIYDINNNFYNNTTDFDALATARINHTYNRIVSLTDPYVDRPNDNFSLVRNASGLKQLIPIGDIDAINFSYFTQGVPSGGG